MPTLRRVQTVISGSLVNGGGLSTHYFDTSVGNEQDAASAVLTFWQSIVPVINSAVTFTVQPLVALINDETGDIQSLVGVTGGAATGGTSFEPLPPSTQGLLRIRTGVFSDGREIRGRLFIPGATEAVNFAGKPQAPFPATVDAAAIALRDSTVANWTVWRRPRLADPTHVPPIGARPGTHATVNSATTWSEWAVLRSRRD